jgi:DNA-binding NarL/FixJ family response regulator
LGALRAALAGAVAGHGRLALIAGEAGLGKTALVETLVAEASDAGAVVLCGHAYDLDTAPYEPWVELLRAYQGGESLPALPPGLGSAEILETLAGKDALFAQFAAFVVELANELPAVLVLEDLHWSDQASLDLLRALARRISRWPVLMTATFRDRELTPQQPLPRILPLLVRETRPLRVDLRPLDDEAVRHFLGERYSLPESAEKRLVRHVQQYAEGNPFYITEVLRTLEHERLLRLAGDGWEVGDLTEAPIPLLVRRLIEERVTRLGVRTLRLLQTAAVIGQIIPPDLWYALSDVDDEVFADTVDAARLANLIDETADRTALRFTHALIREALYGSISLPRRRSWHRQIGEWLVAQPQADPDAVAHHFAQAGDPRAVEWLMRAAQRAERRDASRDAIARYEQAIPLLRQQGVSDALAWALVDLAESSRFVDPAQARIHVQMAEQVARDTRDRVLLLAIRWLEIRLRGFLGENVWADLSSCFHGLEAMPAEERAAFTASERFNLPSRGLLAQWMAAHGRYDEAIAYADAVVNEQWTPRTPASHNEWGGAYLALGLAHAGAGRPEAAQAAFAAAREHYQLIGGSYMTASTRKWEWIEVAAPYATDDTERCQRLVDAYATTMAGLTSFAIFRGSRPLLPMFGPATLDGRWAEARESALAYLRVPSWRISALAALGELERRQGKRAAAWGRVHSGLPGGPETEPGSFYFVDVLALLRVAAALALDEAAPDEALPWIEAHERWLDWSGRLLDRVAGLLLRTRYHAARGERAAAAVSAGEALARAKEPRQPLALLHAHCHLGGLASDAGRFEEAARHLDDAFALAESCALPYEEALVCLEQIRLLAARGRWDETLPLRRRTRATLHRLGAAPDLARLDALETQSVDGRLTALPAGLSARQAEVLRLAAQGLSYAEIGDQLYISPRTVARHLQAIYDKLGVTSRAEAAAFAFANGLV